MTLYLIMQTVSNITTGLWVKIRGNFPLISSELDSIIQRRSVWACRCSDCESQLCHAGRETTTPAPHSAEGACIGAGGFHIHHPSTYTLSRDRESTRRSLAAQHVSFALGTAHAILPLVSLFLIKDRRDTPETRSSAKDCVVFIFDTSPAAQELIIFSSNGFTCIGFSPKVVEKV